ncbi:MAG: hypothetical protein Ct9H300mP28_01930 [Pseudomonadota bacterium]|nr:MAG: hypothetical protein Ct9H300mP28_01930 [Pseudomonadota bacterium]
MVLKYHFPHSYYRIPKEVPLPELLEQNESLNGVLIPVGRGLIGSVTLRAIFPFWGIARIFLLFQNSIFSCSGQGKLPEMILPLPANILRWISSSGKEMIFAFAALIWADD